MVYIGFLLCAIVTVYAAVKLSTYADTLSEKTAFGGMFIGTVLLAGATSLPEVSTSLAAIIIHNPDIAVGNVFGSNLFNLFILASIDLYYRKKRMFQGANKEHLYTASIGLLLALVAVLALTIKIDIIFVGIGLDTLLLIVIYIAGLTFISKKTKKGVKQTAVIEQQAVKKEISLKQAIIGFIVVAIIISISGTFLSISGDKIAFISGLGSTFVGSFLIAATTSLPEAVSVLMAVNLRNYNLAIGAILGSNMFNMLILGGADLLYKDGTLLANVSEVHRLTASAVAVLSIITIYTFLRRGERSTFLYSLPSLLLIVMYFLSSYLIFSF